MKKVYIKPESILMTIEDICESGIGIASGTYDGTTELSKGHNSFFSEDEENSLWDNEHKNLWDD